LLLRGSWPFTLIESLPNDSVLIEGRCPEAADEADEVAVDAGQLHERFTRDVAADFLRGDVDER
jgi:hypothetical protein